MFNNKIKYTRRAFLSALLLFNILAFNYSAGINIKGSEKNLIIESFSSQDVIISFNKTSKVSAQKIISGSFFVSTDDNSGEINFNNFIKSAPNHFQLLSFQFFLATQFSTDT